MGTSVFKFKGIISSLLLVTFIGMANISCNKKDYPCPGLGKSNEADLSMFDETGKLKNDKDHGRIDRSTGLIKKKKPKKLNARRKTHI